jgi:murein DD-endopeptidase MepM/ murein hydrolase activator NlpD
MWPFNNNLKDKLRNQDALKRYQDWLKKWFLRGAKIYAVALSIALVAVIGTFLGVKYWLLAPTQPVNETTNPNKTAVTEKLTNQTNQQTTEALNKTTNSTANNAKNSKQAANKPEPTVDINQLTMPVTAKVLLTFNEPYYSEIYQDYRFSEGIQFQTSQGQAVQAALAGKVITTEQDQYNGYIVVIDHGQGYQTKYSGLETIAVEPNQQINQTQTLGTATDNKLKFTLTKDGTPIELQP